jgi:FMN-dependent NADH-azoreductase
VTGGLFLIYRPISDARHQPTDAGSMIRSGERCVRVIDALKKYSAPMHNFGIPSQLKAWIDCLAAPGKTFSHIAMGVKGLAGGKKVIIASSPMAFMDHRERFLTSFFGFVGVTDITFVRAEGVNTGPEQRQRAIEFALPEIADLKAAREKYRR